MTDHAKITSADLARLFERFRADHDHEGNDCPDACYVPGVIEPDDAYQLFALHVEPSPLAEHRSGFTRTVKEADAEAGECPVCRGTGADPMSDNVNWPPCSTCAGSGTAPEGRKK